MILLCGYKLLVCIPRQTLLCAVCRYESEERTQLPCCPSSDLGTPLLQLCHSSRTTQPVAPESLCRSPGSLLIPDDRDSTDTNAPGPINYLGYLLMKTKQTRMWRDYLQFILRNLRNADPNATQGSNPLYNNVNGKWNPASPSLTDILNNVCQASSCN